MRVFDRLSPLPPFTFRVEAPLWHKLEDGMAAPSLDEQAVPNHRLARESPTDKRPRSMGSSNGINCREARTGGAEEPAEEEAAEEESCVPATGQGYFSFEMSLLQRAAQTFAKR